MGRGSVSDYHTMSYSYLECHSADNLAKANKDSVSFFFLIHHHSDNLIVYVQLTADGDLEWGTSHRRRHQMNHLKQSL